MAYQLNNIIALPDGQLEDIRTQLLTVTIRLFGRSRNIEFYRQRVGELLNLYSIEENQISIVVNDITEESLTEIKVIYPTNDFELWQETHQLSSHQFFDSINIIAFIERITHYDIRIALSLLFSLGLLPKIQTIGEFQRVFGVSSNFIIDYTTNGLRLLLEDLLVDDIVSLTSSKMNKLVIFLQSLDGFDTDRLLRYTDGQLISSDSNIYKLAKILAKRRTLDLSKLSTTQKKFIELFTRDFSETGKFISYFQVAQELGISIGSIHKHIEDILDKVSTKKEYIRTKNGKIVEVDMSSPQGQLISMFNRDPDLLRNTNLNNLHRNYLGAFFQSKDENGIYTSLAAIAQGFGVSPTNFTYVIQDAIDRIEQDFQKDEFYLNKDGARIAHNEARIKLMKLAEEPDFYQRLPTDKTELVRLLLAREGNKFIYSNRDIANLLNIDSDHPDKSIISQVFRLVKKLTKDELAYIDESNRPIIKSYHTLLEIINNKGVPEIIWTRISSFDSQVFKRLMQIDEYDRYSSYELIAQEFFVKPHNIRDVVTRVLKRLRECLEV